jgi:uncharacterized cupredoxin-like copper-binding protein
VVQVSLEDFKIDVQSHATADRDITLHVVNHGPTMHEVNVVRTDLPPEALPLRADGMTVDDQSPQLEHVVEAEGLDINHQRNLKLHLSPGHYVFYCNMEGHYLGHMFTSFEVTA